MRLTFQIRFHTQYGQSLWLTGNHALFGQGELERAIPLQYHDDSSWQLTLVLPSAARPDADITYNYILRNADGSVVYDWGNDKHINLARFTHDEVLLIDSWNHAGFFENAFYTEPFKRVLLKGTHTPVDLPGPQVVTHQFKVKAPLLTKGQTVCLLGNTAALGNWNPARTVLLARAPDEDFFCAGLDLTGGSFPLAYKYGVYDIDQRAFVRFEDRPNRVLYDAVSPHKQTMVNDGFVVLPNNTWRGAGVSLPVFSLRSETSFGVGEFSDLKRLADWCRLTGLKLIQILPVNDTTATWSNADSYPYAAISAFALHPIYLNLGQVTGAKSKRLLESLEPERQRLNGLTELNYEAVLKTKFEFLRKIYPLQKTALFRTRDYQRFFDQNKHWLVPYAAFCYLRDLYGTCDFARWPAHQTYNAEVIAALAAPGSAAYDELALNYFIQYHLHFQLREAAEYAHANGIILKGDIAIGVYRYGTDAWQEPAQYCLNVQAGAPPDAFGIKGQNWGFPTYNWPRMMEDGFAWWKRRFSQMNRYFDAFRIDHILGFFRIWSIPLHAVEGILGYFVPAIPVQPSEFERRGIRFDRGRYTRPYITEQVLSEVFGPDRDWVKSHFLQTDDSGQLAFKPEFSTQRQVEQCFATWKPEAHHERIKEGLYDLISNVLLFEVKDAQGAQLHFRFGIENTSSFKALDLKTQAGLRDLYIDYFYRRQDDFWMQEALQKLPALKRVTNMLVCGEDLGMVPACVPDVMKLLGLLSLEVQRMPKIPGQQFSRPADAPYLSVITPSTHDMSTIRGWWEEDPEVTQRFFHQELGLPGPAPAQCEAWINQAIVLQHLQSPAMWSVFQLQDLLGTDERLRRANPAEERINVPADPRHYWRYRMHLSLEQLSQSEAFNSELRRCIHSSGR
jgi:4-alpha-glucanotransferase